MKYEKFQWMVILKKCSCILINKREDYLLYVLYNSASLNQPISLIYRPISLIYQLYSLNQSNNQFHQLVICTKSTNQFHQSLPTIRHIHKSMNQSIYFISLIHQIYPSIHSINQSYSLNQSKNYNLLTDVQSHIDENILNFKFVHAFQESQKLQIFRTKNLHLITWNEGLFFCPINFTPVLSRISHLLNITTCIGHQVDFHTWYSQFECG